MRQSQFYSHREAKWVDVGTVHSGAYLPERYRVKKEPVEIELYYKKGEHGYMYFTASPALPPCEFINKGYTKMKFRQVI